MFYYYDSVRVLHDPKTNVAIGIEWIKDDGTKERFYPDNVNEDWFLTYVDEIRKDSSLGRKERYHIETHLESMPYEGDLFADDRDPRSEMDLFEENEKVTDFLTLLNDTERRRLEFRLDNPKMSFEKISKIEKVSKTAIFKTYNSLRNKYNAYFY